MTDCSFLSIVTFTPKYLTVFVHLTPAISSSFSPVSISDFFLLRRRFHRYCRFASSPTIVSTSARELDITSISSANARRSPLFLTSSSLFEDFSASSRYTLNSTGDRIDPCGSPISAFMVCVPI